MSTNIELEQWCKQLKIQLNAIRSKDDLPKLYQRRSGLYIINSEDLLGGKGGIHWVGLYIEGNQSVYFDSFAGYPYRQVKEFATSRLYFNRDQLQHIDSTMCGHFVLYFGYCMNIKYKHIKGLQNRLVLCVRQFNLKDLEQNDEILTKKLKSLRINI